MTGIPRTRPRKQCNQLRRWGIKTEVNARREVVCFHAWMEAAAPPEGSLFLPFLAGLPPMAKMPPCRPGGRIALEHLFPQFQP